MRNVSLLLLAVVLTLTFTASEIVVEKRDKPDDSKKCPYLERLQQSGNQLECPFLSGTESGSACPYMNEKSESESGVCPYLEGQSGECPYMNGNAAACPYMKEHGEDAIKAIETHPLPEGKNT